jgi:hypothetical protein
VNNISAIVQLGEMPWRGEVELAAELADGDMVIVDRWYADERQGHVHPATFSSLIGTDIKDLQNSRNCSSDSARSSPIVATPLRSSPSTHRRRSIERAYTSRSAFDHSTIPGSSPNTPDARGCGR